MRAIGKANNMSIRIQFLEPDGSAKFPVNGKDKEQFGGNQPIVSTEENHLHQPAVTPHVSDLGKQSDDDLGEFILN
jgi:hypothetical protein